MKKTNQKGSDKNSGKRKGGMNSKLAKSFDQIALEYDRYRPEYPIELISDIVAISEIPKGGRILEIGCGTGKASMPFAEMGYTMLCIDPGKNLLELARSKCKKFRRVSFVEATFEAAKIKPNIFDLVIAAQSFHWVNPAVGYKKSCRVLKDSGSVAFF